MDKSRHATVRSSAEASCATSPVVQAQDRRGRGEVRACCSHLCFVRFHQHPPHLRSFICVKRLDFANRVFSGPIRPGQLAVRCQSIEAELKAERAARKSDRVCPVFIHSMLASPFSEWLCRLEWIMNSRSFSKLRIRLRRCK